MKVVCVSDTHGLHEDALAIPDGDVFIHAGDFTDTGERSEVLAFNEFLGRLPHRYKLVIAGNHESTFDRAFYPQFWHQYGHRQQYEPEEVRALLTNALYLEDQAVLIEGFVFYGTPWQPEFCNWAFNLPRGDALLKKWRHIPSDTDVLITHSPPMGHGDLVGYQRVGCADLLKEVETRVRPKLHVFGHVHEGYGRSASSDGEITYFNASTCTHNYEPVNAPFVFELTGPPKRGWPKRTLPLSTPSNGLGMHRSFSSNDVSSISSLSTTEDEDVDMDGEINQVVEAEPRDYDLMLHEWLRQCSHKPPFIEKKLVEVELCEVARKELREFRVDGTTSGLLFQSTLKLRPVTNVQKCVLRYLFTQGFRNNSENYKAEKAGDEQVTAQDENRDEDTATGMQVDSGNTKPARERRNYGIARRVTVAVLDDIDEDKEGMDDRDREHVQHARVAAAALGKDLSTEQADSSPGSRRPRRNKTLQRRSAVPKLASLTEEPSEGEENATEKVSGQEKASESTAMPEAIVVAPPVVECVLCKYKVPGHVHPGAVATPPPAPVEPPKEKLQEKPSEPRSRAENPPPKRLSSWF
ncbi:hypothetical protein DVH05_007109 [Phytophthora capsici]|nr:hypothetical protein DVH05_007109 [Phytophthora capsici]|eukprot:jgi/Phyca11/531158/estExt2_fgenesh1_pm.C_PHYCAscaffold_980004